MFYAFGFLCNIQILSAQKIIENSIFRKNLLEYSRKFQGAYLDGHVLALQFSEREGRAKPQTSEKRDPGKAFVSSTKLVVKNVAFEVKKKDLQELFKPFGQVRLFLE